MRRGAMKYLGISVLVATGLLGSLATAVAGAAHAATVTNTGGTAVVLQVTEDGARMDLPLDPGQSQTICPAGCFVTLPDGDRLGLEGSETLEVKDGIATVR